MKTWLLPRHPSKLGSFAFLSVLFLVGLVVGRPLVLFSLLVGLPFSIIQPTKSCRRLARNFAGPKRIYLLRFWVSLIWCIFSHLPQRWSPIPGPLGNREMDPCFLAPSHPVPLLHLAF